MQVFASIPGPTGNAGFGSISAICRPTQSCASTPENGFVWLPEEAHRLDDFMSERDAFPMAATTTRSISIAQALALPKRPSTTGMIDFWAGRQGRGAPLARARSSRRPREPPMSAPADGLRPD